MSSDGVIRFDSAIRVPLWHHEASRWSQLLQDDLTRTQRNDRTGEMDTSKFALEDNQSGEILFPLFSPVPADWCLGLPVDRPDLTGLPLGIRCHATPRNQREEDAYQWMVGSWNGILMLFPGEGKTVVTIRALCAIGRKSIIMVHKNHLGDQWRERFLMFTDAKREDIVFLNNAKFEKCLGAPVLIVTVQGMHALYKKIGSRCRDMIEAAGYGFLAVDEVHNVVGAEKFSISSMMLPVARRFGLSATPDRYRNADIMSIHLGPVWTPASGAMTTMDARVEAIIFDYGLATDPRMGKYIYWGGVFSPDHYLRAQKKCARYRSMVELILSNLKAAGRNSLVLAERIDLLDGAQQMVEPEPPAGEEPFTGFFLPREKKAKWDHLKRKMVFSTYQSARDGLDKPPLDAMVMLTPTGNLEQCAGRIVRGLEGKKEPVIYDLVDIGCPEMERKWRYRKTFYEQKGWVINEHTPTFLT